MFKLVWRSMDTKLSSAVKNNSLFSFYNTFCYLDCNIVGFSCSTREDDFFGIGANQFGNMLLRKEKVYNFRFMIICLVISRAAYFVFQRKHNFCISYNFIPCSNFVTFFIYKGSNAILSAMLKTTFFEIAKIIKIRIQIYK